MKMRKFQKSSGLQQCAAGMLFTYFSRKGLGFFRLRAQLSFTCAKKFISKIENPLKAYF